MESLILWITSFLSSSDMALIFFLIKFNSAVVRLILVVCQDLICKSILPYIWETMFYKESLMIWKTSNLRTWEGVSSFFFRLLFNNVSLIFYYSGSKLLSARISAAFAFSSSDLFFSSYSNFSSFSFSYYFFKLSASILLMAAFCSLYSFSVIPNSKYSKLLEFCSVGSTN